MEKMFTLSSKSTVSNWLDCSEWMLLLFGVVLVVGLVGEIKTPSLSPLYKKFEWIVVIGVLGELVADGGIFLFSSALQRLSDIEVAVLNKSAAELENANLQLREHLEIMSKMQRSRAIPEAAVIAMLKGASPRKVILRYQTGDSETYLFASGLQSVFISAGWRVIKFAPISTLVGIAGTGLRDIIVGMRHPERSRDEATPEGVIQKAMELIQAANLFGIGQHDDKSLPDDTFVVYVGPKQPPLM